MASLLGRNGLQSFAVRCASRDVGRNLYSTGSADPGCPPLTAVITGGTSRIGAAIARQLAEGLPARLGGGPGRLRPVRCVLIGRDAERLQAQLGALPDSGAHGYALGDVSSSRFWADLGGGRVDGWDQAGSRLGPVFGRRGTAEAAPVLSHVDFFVHAAGVAHASPLRSTAAETVERVVGTNLVSLMYAVPALSPYLLRSPSRPRPGRGGGAAPAGPSPCIVSISSVLSTRQGRGAAAYAASKAGVDGLTRALSAELTPVGVRVNGVAPGWVAETGMSRDFLRPEEVRARIPAGRLCEPEEVADAVLFAIMAGYLTGQTIVLDGGLSAM